MPNDHPSRLVTPLKTLGLGDSAEGSDCRIGAFEVYPSRNLLKHGTDRFTVEPRVMDVLCTLAEHQGSVATRADLIERHWANRFGGDECLTRAVSQLRKAFKAADPAETYIETVAKRGYRLVQPARGFEPRAAAPSDGATPSELAPSYSVAVMPLRSAGGPAEERLAEAIGHDLVEMLSRTPNLRVAAYAAHLKEISNELDPKQLGQLLNVHYVISGSLTRYGDVLTLRVELADAFTNVHLLSWKLSEVADAFKADFDDFLLDLSAPVVTEIQIAEASLAHTRQQVGDHACAVIHSTEMLRSVYSEQRAHEIVDHLNVLVERDPDNAYAHASLAVQLAQNVVSAWSEAPSDDFAAARSHIKTALNIAPRDADVQASAGIVAFMMRESETAVRLLTRSLRQNPNNPHALAVLGFHVGVKGGDEAGIDMIRTAEKRAPHHPRYPIWAQYRGSCFLAFGRLDDAREAYREAIDRNPNYHLSYVVLATALVLSDRLDEARSAIADALENSPRYSFENWMALLDAFPELYQWQSSKAAFEEKCRRAWVS